VALSTHSFLASTRTVAEEKKSQSSVNAEAIASDLYEKTRLKSLLLKWSKRGRILQSEFEEVRGLLPPDMVAIFAWLSALRKCGDCADASGYARYEKPLTEYEKIFAIKVRQLKKYIAIGKAATPPKLPPFDCPGEMPAWWVRHMKQRVPPKLLALAATPLPDAPKTADARGINVELSRCVRAISRVLYLALNFIDDLYTSGAPRRKWGAGSPRAARGSVKAQAPSQPKAPEKLVV
jgi:hypothetical protein